MKVIPFLTLGFAAGAEEALTMQVVKHAEREIVLTKRFESPRERVFRALTDPSEVARWMNAGNLELVSCEIDLRVGGTLRWTYRRPSGKTIQVRGVFAEVTKPRGFTYEESYDFSPLTITVTTTLESIGAATLFQQRLFYLTQSERDTDFDNIASSSPIAYANLERHLAK